MSAALWLDIIVLAIIVLCVIITAKRGFVRCVVFIVGLVAAAFIVASISEPISKFIYAKCIEPSILKSTTAAADRSAQLTGEKIWNAFPKLVTENAEKFNIDKSAVLGRISDNLQKGASAAVSSVTDILVKPVMTKLISGIVAAVLFILLIPLVRWIAKLVNGLFSFSFIGGINRFAGGVLGLFEGVVFAAVFCIIVALTVIFSYGKFGLTFEVIQSTKVFKILYNLIPFV